MILIFVCNQKLEDNQLNLPQKIEEKC